MNIIIRTKNLESKASVEDLIKKRMMGVEKMADAFQKSLELLVDVEKETTHHKKGDIFFAEARLHLPGKKLVAKSHSDDLKKAITEVRDELEMEIKKYKAKVLEVPRRKYRKSLRKTQGR
jgi:ribosomal subunit interface protein